MSVGYFPDLVRPTTMQQTLFTHGFACLARTGHPLPIAVRTGSAKPTERCDVMAKPPEGLARCRNGTLRIEIEVNAHFIR